jgi:type I restriction enzyme S subunit
VKLKKIKLQDCCEITSSKRIYYSDYVDQGIPFYRSKEIIELSKGKNISERLFISYDKYEKIKKKFGIPQGGDMLLTSVGTIGIPYIVRKKDIFYFKDGNLIWFKKFNKNLLSKYLFIWIKSKYGQSILNNMTIGSSQKALTIEMLKNLVIEIPPIDIQKSIVKIIWNYSLLIENNQKQIKLLEEAAQRLYKEWFVDLHFPGYEDAKIVDGVPEGWKWEKLGNLPCRLETGKRPKGGIDNSLKDGIPSIGAENVIGLGQYNYSSEKFIPLEFYSNLKKGKVKDRDILIYKDGAYIGRTSLFQDDFPHKRAAVNEHVFLLHMTQEKLQYYVFFTLYQKTYYYEMRKLNKNAAQPGINQKAMKSLNILIPDEKIIEKFDTNVSIYLKEIFILANQNHILQEARDRLLPKLMSGEIEV